MYLQVLNRFNVGRLFTHLRSTHDFCLVMVEANAGGRLGRLIASCGVIWTTNGRPPTYLIALFHPSFTAYLESFWPFLPDLTSSWVAALRQSCDIASCLTPLGVPSLRIFLELGFRNISLVFEDRLLTVA